VVYIKNAYLVSNIFSCKHFLSLYYSLVPFCSAYILFIFYSIFVKETLKRQASTAYKGSSLKRLASPGYKGSSLKRLVWTQHTNMYLGRHISWCPKNKLAPPRSHILKGPEFL